MTTLEDEYYRTIDVINDWWNRWSQDHDPRVAEKLTRLYNLAADLIETDWPEQWTQELPSGSVQELRVQAAKWRRA